MVNRLSRDYWPAETRYVFGRVVLAFLLSPVIAAAVLFILLLSLEFILVGAINLSQSQTIQVAPTILIGSFTITLTGGLICFLVLWSLKLRGRLHYIMIGMVAGLVLSSAFLMINSQALNPIAITIATIHLSVVMLVFRAIAGVRRLDA